ncbi:MAG: class I SAM-dependent methyltransferase [Acidobacteria bacterium]|nr:class I SAM-dependent methyltransferase [Acidobacteriota bacterium]
MAARSRNFQSLREYRLSAVKNFRARLLPLIDILTFPFVYPAAWLLKTIRRVGVGRLPLCKKVFMNVGVFPIRNHYYEPQFDYRNLKQPLSQERILPGIDWNVPGQLKMLAELSFSHELAELQQEKAGLFGYDPANLLFGPGDAEYWYQLIRRIKPRRLFEIGGGNSTVLAKRALQKNCRENSNYECSHICIEPYERPWLESTGVTIIRQKVEDLGSGFFAELQADDILFIDSSHIIRPQGDVLFEYLELLPILKKGVIVHTHDNYSPRNYPEQSLVKNCVFWNEQFLIEAFLSHNSCWEILGALNYLHHNHYDKLKSIAPFLTPGREPCSLYIRRIK